MKCFWIFKHNWEKWVDIDHGTATFAYGVKKYVRQKRYCKDCGKIEIRNAYT